MKFFKTLFERETPADTIDEIDHQQLAIAALLVEAARADEHFAEDERTIIEHFLAQNFDLDADAAKSLLAQAETAQADAIDIHRFTKQVKELPQDEKIKFIEGLWHIVLSDGERDAFEDALIRRVCGLIYVTDRESSEARKAVLAGLS